MVQSSSIYLPEAIRAKISRMLIHIKGREMCGLLVGYETPGETIITHLVHSPNISKRPTCEFQINPIIQFRVQRRLRHTHLTVVGVFHSHPSNHVYPSASDILTGRGDGMVWLISDGLGRIFRAFELDCEDSVKECTIISFRV